MNTPILPEDLDNIDYLQQALIYQLMYMGKNPEKVGYTFEQLENPIFIYHELMKLQSGSYLDKPIF